MNGDSPDDLSAFSMLDLFKAEVDSHKVALEEGLLGLEGEPASDERLEGLMRAAHSIKGAARIVNLDVAVTVAHAMEDCFESLRRHPEVVRDRGVAGRLDRPDLSPAHRHHTRFRGLLTDVMLAASDLLAQMAATPEAEIGGWSSGRHPEVEAVLSDLRVVMELQNADDGPADGAVAGAGTADASSASPANDPAADLSAFSMLDLFKVEVGNQKAVLENGLLHLEQHPTDADQLQELMRAAHSIKGAARIVNLDAAVTVAHAMEDAFEDLRAHPERLVKPLPREKVAAGGLPEKCQAHTTFPGLLADVMLAAVDLLARIANTPESGQGIWQGVEKPRVTGCLEHLAVVRALSSDAPVAPASAGPQAAKPGSTSPVPEPPPVPEPEGAGGNGDSFLRITATNLNRLLALTGELQVEARRLRPFSENLNRLKRQLAELNLALDGLRDTLACQPVVEQTREQLAEIRDRVNGARHTLGERLTDLESIGRRSASVSGRLYDTALSCRMRPFADGVQGFPRMVRDLTRRLGKQAKLEVIGRDTQVDRDILEKLEGLITQLLRNALDHGLETPEERQAAGKPPQGRLTLEARHSNGKLLVSVADDGRGIHYDRLRQAIVRRGLINEPTAARLSESELLEFLFLPGFSQRESVTEISGRGVGLDIVYSTVKSVRGAVRIYPQPGRGTRFELQLPLTLSVVRGLLVEIEGEPYAFPLAQTVRTLKVPRAEVLDADTLPRLRAGRDHEEIRLVRVNSLFGRASAAPGDEWHVVVAAEREHTFGLVVDRFLGERELVVQPLDPRLGKVRDLSAGALTENGLPVLILDVQDLIHDAEKYCHGENTLFLTPGELGKGADGPPRVLVVDDSLTVREMERQLLQQAGYLVTVAVDGMDGWNALRAGVFDLVVTDLDMPRMSGLELAGHIRQDPALANLPIIMVTYKDRAEDRQKAFTAGVDCFLTKGSFQDASFLRTVEEYVGAAVAATSRNPGDAGAE